VSLEVTSLKTGYRDVVAVHSIDVSVEPGAVTALLGRNGAGKTTTLHAIAGLLPVMSGSIMLDGKDIGSLPASRRASLGLSLVQEGKRVFRGMSVDQNLVLGAYSARMSRGDLESRKDAAYTRFPDLTKKRTHAAGSLSGGQQQMLAIAQALMSQPRILMLDEPCAGLSPAITGQIFDTVVRLREEGMGILLVEQSVEFALGCANRVSVVNLGRNVFEGTPDEPGFRDRIAEAFMGGSRVG
jgi:branched-chain amino acid transport system ATP-binding protein